MATKRTTGIDRHVGAMIRLYRAEAGLTQTKLADSLGISFQQVQKYERGTNRVSAGSLYVIAGVLGRVLDDFFPARRLRAIKWRRARP
jgi:transcriptional regulator with XRE-family HTH domain